ncbi:MAG: hypothetical protein PHR06_09290 [Candidatus Cloacimonetes bacterium]|nr:hypothetical protein [Candidatus Cloacimonadota bacterium]
MIEQDVIIVKRKPRKCKICGSSKVAFIFYGLPAMDDELQKKIDDGKIVLGGCVICGDDPKWECLGCHQKYGYEKSAMITAVEHIR